MIDGRVDRVQDSCAEGVEFVTQLNQTNNLYHSHLSLPNEALSINMLGQGLVRTVSG